MEPISRKQLLKVASSVAEALMGLDGTNRPEPFPVSLVDIQAWEWGQGVGLYGLYQYEQWSHNVQVRDFLMRWYHDHFRCPLPVRNVNTTSPLRLLTQFQVLGIEQDEVAEYDEACRDWANWLLNGLPRTGPAIFQHTITDNENTGQILIDTLFMAGLFLLQAGIRFQREDYVAEAVYQWLAHIQFLQQNNTGLFSHGWTFTEQHGYGCVPWGRGNGWFTAGTMDLLELLDSVGAMAIPLGGSFFQAVRRVILQSWQRQLDALAPLQGTNGMWHTVLDEASSYPETSATAAIAYGIFKAVRLGVLGQQWIVPARRALIAVLDQIDSQGAVHQVSYGTPVGSDRAFYRQISTRVTPYGQGLALMLFAEAAWHL